MGLERKILLSVNATCTLGVISQYSSFTECTLVVVGILRLRQNTRWQQNASFDGLLSRAGLGHLGKGRLFVATPLEDYLTGLMGSSTRAGTGVRPIAKH